MAQAASTPDRVAVRAGDEALTYAALAERSGALACCLRYHGVASESLVGIIATPSISTIVAELGVLRAGAAFVPIDPQTPPARLRTMLASGIRVVVAGTGGPPPGLDTPTIDVSRLPPSTHRPRPPELSADSAAYVMYTSGSTGEPKGVINTHGGFLSSTLARSAVYRDPVRSFLLLSPLFFDSSLAGIYWSLSTGGEVVLVPAPAIDPEATGRAARRVRASHLLALGSLYGALLDLGGDDAFGSLRLAIVAGEPCGLPVQVRHRELLPRTRFAVEWGVTEASVWSTVDDDAEAIPNPLGRPIPGVSVAVRRGWVDEAGAGVPGQLLIGGNCLARGYLRDPGATARNFVPDPAGPPGARCYRTGDRGVRGPGGRLRFLGRVDNQVKLRGIRIEPGEVEAALRSCPAVRDCAVVPVRDADGTAQSLVAFAVPAGGRPVWPSQVHGYLLARLPRHLVPARVVVVAELPTLPSGKVDRAGLESGEAGGGARPGGGPGSGASPDDPVVGFLAAIWSEVLGIPRVAADDNFFDLGGHSLTALRIAGRIRAELGIPIRVNAVFEAPTVGELAALIDGDGHGTG